jgi:hypothetical protein
MVIYHYQVTLKIAQMKYLFVRANEKKRLGQLKNNLKRRGYKQSIIKKSFYKAVYFSKKKNRNVKEPLVSSHTIPVYETASTPFVGIGHPSKNIPNCPKSFLILQWLPSNNQTV